MEGRERGRDAPERHQCERWGEGGRPASRLAVRLAVAREGRLSRRRPDSVGGEGLHYRNGHGRRGSWRESGDGRRGKPPAGRASWRRGRQSGEDAGWWREGDGEMRGRDASGNDAGGGWEGNAMRGRDCSLKWGRQREGRGRGVEAMPFSQRGEGLLEMMMRRADARMTRQGRGRDACGRISRRGDSGASWRTDWEEGFRRGRAGRRGGDGLRQFPSDGKPSEDAGEGRSGTPQEKRGTFCVRTVYFGENRAMVLVSGRPPFRVSALVPINQPLSFHFDADILQDR